MFVSQSIKAHVSRCFVSFVFAPNKAENHSLGLALDTSRSYHRSRVATRIKNNQKDGNNPLSFSSFLPLHIDVRRSWKSRDQTKPQPERRPGIAIYASWSTALEQRSVTESMQEITLDTKDMSNFNVPAPQCVPRGVNFSLWCDLFNFLRFFSALSGSSFAFNHCIDFGVCVSFRVTPCFLLLLIGLHFLHMQWTSIFLFHKNTATVVLPIGEVNQN